MKIKTTIKMLKLSLIMLFILNVSLFIYCIVLMIENNIINIMLFLVFIIISIVSIFYVKRKYEIYGYLSREALDFMLQANDSINDLLKKDEMSKNEAHKLKEENQKLSDFNGEKYGFFGIILKFSIILFSSPVILLLLQLTFKDFNVLGFFNIRIYVIILGTISQLLIIIFSKIIYDL